jgi:hypothetical protein
MPTPPCDQPRHVVARDLGKQLVLAEKLDQERKIVVSVVSASVVLPDFLPVTLSHVVEAQRGLGRRQLRNEPRRLLVLGRCYFFGFTPRRAFRRAVNPMTSHLEVEVEIRRAAVSVLIDGHGTSFRVWLVMKSSRSASVNLMRLRFLPWPTST